METTKYRILVVDDEASVRESYKNILCENSESIDQDLAAKSAMLFGEAVETGDQKEFDVSFASQGLEAIELVEQSLKDNAPFSLIFLDIRMPPGIDGKETGKRIRALDSDVEIVIMTAYSDFSFEEIKKDIGHTEKIACYKKPFTTEQIRAIADSLTQKWEVDRDDDQDGDLFDLDFDGLEDEFSKKKLERDKFEVWKKTLLRLEEEWSEESQRIYQNEIDLQNPFLLKINVVRKSIKTYILRKVEKILTLEDEKVRSFYQNITFFHSIYNLPKLIEHFFAMRREQGKWFLKKQDVFQKELFVLFDLLKIQKNLEITELITELLKSGKLKLDFLPNKAAIKLLDDLSFVFKMAFRQNLKVDYVHQFEKEIPLNLFRLEETKKRKNFNIRYCNNRALFEGAYERFFFHLIFANYLKTKFKGEIVELEYNLTVFELIKRKVLTNWLLKINDEKVKTELYQKFEFLQQPFDQWILANPQAEEDFLNEIPKESFQTLIMEMEQSEAVTEPLPFVPLEKNEDLKKVEEEIGDTAIELNFDPNQNAHKIPFFQKFNPIRSYKLIQHPLELEHIWEEDLDLKPLKKSKKVYIIFEKEDLILLENEIKKYMLKYDYVDYEIQSFEKLLAGDVDEGSICVFMRTTREHLELFQDKHQNQNLLLIDLRKNLFESINKYEKILNDAELMSLIQELESFEKKGGFLTEYHKKVLFDEVKQMKHSIERKLSRKVQEHKAFINILRPIYLSLLMECYDLKTDNKLMYESMIKATSILFITDHATEFKKEFDALGFDTKSNFQFFTRFEALNKLKVKNIAEVSSENTNFDIIIGVDWKNASNDVVPFYVNVKKSHRNIQYVINFKEFLYENQLNGLMNKVRMFIPSVPKIGNSFLSSIVQTFKEFSLLMEKKHHVLMKMKELESSIKIKLESDLENHKNKVSQYLSRRLEILVRFLFAFQH